MGQAGSLEESRFSMVKKHHKKTFFDALEQKKVDPQVISLCKFFANSKNFFTSSTCCGRIVLLKVSKSESKQHSAFIAKWHQKTGFKEVRTALLKKTMGEIWFKQEPFILHVGSKNFKLAKELLQIAKECGIKRAGISVAKTGKFLLEMIGTQNIAFPVKNGEKLLIGDEELKYVLKRANEKLEKNYVQLKEFEKKCAQKLG